MKTVTIAVGLLLALCVAAPAAARSQTQTPQNGTTPSSGQLENRRQLALKVGTHLKQVEQQFQEVCRKMDATVAERKKQNRPLTAEQLAGFQEQWKLFNFRLQEAKDHMKLLQQEDTRSTRQQTTADLEAAEQKANQLMNTLSNIVTTMREIQASLAKGIS